MNGRARPTAPSVGKPIWPTAVAWQLNPRPHKSLGWKCPAELFMPESFDFFQQHH